MVFFIIYLMAFAIFFGPMAWAWILKLFIFQDILLFFLLFYQVFLYGLYNMKLSYSSKWILQRISALFLIPLSFWFIYQCISFQKLNYFELQIFFQSYLNSFLFLLMMSFMLLHAKLGCETIVKDYISLLILKKFFNFLINFLTFFSLFLVIVAIIRLGIF